MPWVDQTAFVARGAQVMGWVEIGARSSIWYQCVIRGDTEVIRIGEDTNIQDFTMVHADPGIPCLVGNRVTVGHRVILHGCEVEDDCLIGMGAILLNGVRIGAGSIVAAGAVLTERQEVPPGSIVRGIPGKVVGEATDAQRARIERGWRNYVELAQRHRAREFPAHE
jgi:carbonic anhydrase/acetyltransferase-like protein (isoleucine patch superfamily)